MSIRKGHTDYVACLDIGMVTVTQDGIARNAACGGGFLSVEKGEVRLVATTFEYAGDIDVERAQVAVSLAEEKIAVSKEAKDIELAKVKLARALNRISIAQRKE